MDLFIGGDHFHREIHRNEKTNPGEHICRKKCVENALVGGVVPQACYLAER